MSTPRGLRAAGYHVLEASDGVQALAVVLAAGVRIDLLLTDIIMPNMGGLQLAECLTVDGRLPIFLFITGYDQDWSKIPGAGLEKPFGPDQLVAEVRRCTTRHPENIEALPGCVWLDTPGKVLHVEASSLEFRSDPPSVNAHS